MTVRYVDPGHIPGAIPVPTVFAVPGVIPRLPPQVMVVGEPTPTPCRSGASSDTSPVGQQKVFPGISVKDATNYVDGGASSGGCSPTSPPSYSPVSHVRCHSHDRTPGRLALPEAGLTRNARSSSTGNLALTFQVRSTSPLRSQGSKESCAAPAEEPCSAGWGTVERTFRAFCGTKPEMEGKAFAKLCKDCDLIDRSLTDRDVDIIFAKVTRGSRRIDLQQFDQALVLLAEKKGVELEEVCRLVRGSGGPVLKSTKADYMRFHDDKSTYTGTHAQGGPDSGSKGRGSLPPAWNLRRESSVDEQVAESTSALAAKDADPDSPDAPPAMPRRPSGTAATTMVAVPLRGKDGTLEDTFRAYCSSKPDMDGKSFVKLLKDCRLIDTVLTATDADILFVKVVPRTLRRMTLQHFKEAMKLVAGKRGIDEGTVEKAVAQCNGLVLKGTQTESVRFYDDKSTYTGIHLHGASDSSTKAPTPLQMWSSSLRPDEGEMLPDMVRQKLGEGSPVSPPSHLQLPTSLTPGGSSSTSRPASKEASGFGSFEAQRPLPPRARTPRPRQQTIKSKPPGETDDVTMVFTDVQGSTNLWEANPSAMEQALRLHDATIRKVLAKYNGYEVTTEGDAFQVVFHDAVDAVGFCLDTQTELLRCDWPEKTLMHPEAAASKDGAWRGLRVRMGVHTGRPAAVTKHEMTGRVRYAGPSVALAKAVEGVCHGGQIVISAASFHNIDGLLTQLKSPQVVDLGEHELQGHGLIDESSEGNGNAVLRLFQLVPEAQSHDYSSCPNHNGTTPGCCGGGRTFPPVLSKERVCPGFDESPAGDCIVLCFVFTENARDLASSLPALASEALGLLRRLVRGALRTAGSGSGYECQEDEGAFMLAFANLDDVAAFGVALQRELPRLPWPAELRSKGFQRGLRVSVGALAGGYTSRRPHTTTGRADYFGTIVNRAARIAASAHPGQVLLGGDFMPKSPMPAPCFSLPSNAFSAPPSPGTLSSGPPSPVIFSPGVQVVGYPPQACLAPGAGPVWPAPGQPLIRSMSVPPAPLQASQSAVQVPPGCSLTRLGSFQLKGIDSPMVLNEVSIYDAQGRAETFPEPKTKGRLGP